MNIRTLIFLLLLCQFTLRAQVSFQKQYGIGGSVKPDYYCGAIQTADGGTMHMLSRQTVSSIPYDGDILLLRTDSLGNSLWKTGYSSTTRFSPHSIIQTKTGGFAIAGGGFFFDGTGPIGKSDMIFIMTDDHGNVQIQRSLGGLIGESASGVCQLADSGFLITGGSSGTFIIVRLDKAGNTQWTKKYNLPNANSHMYTSAIKQLNPTQIALACFFYSGNQAYYDQVVMLKMDTSGNIAFNKAFQLNNSPAMEIAPDGGLIFSSWESLIKLDTLGNIAWAKKYDINSGNGIRGILATSDRGYIFTSSSTVAGQQFRDMSIVKTDSAGNPQWSRAFGGSYPEDGYSVAEMAGNRGYMIAGNIIALNFSPPSPRPFLVKTDVAGGGNCPFSSLTITYSEDTSIHLLTPPAFTYSGTFDSTTSLTVQPYPIADTDNTLCFQFATDVPSSPTISELHVYPNPSTGIVNIESPAHIDFVQVTNITGKVIVDKKTDNRKLNLDLSSQPKGVYFYTIQSSGKILRGKLLLL